MFNIKVVAYPERVEIQGTIPTKVLENRNMRRKPDIAPIISSPSTKTERGSGGEVIYYAIAKNPVLGY
jgi:hypothetical protein